MIQPMQIIAIKMLTGDKAKFYGLVFGIVFATFLMAQQVSIFFGIMDRTANQIIDVHEANIWVMDPLVEYVDEVKPLRDIDLQRVRSVQGVQWAVPFFKGFAIMSTPGLSVKQVLLLGVDDATLIGRPPRMSFGKWEDLKLPDSIIIDRAGWDLIWGDEPYKYGKVVEINDIRLIVVGVSNSAAPFATFPIAYTRYSVANRVTMPGRSRMPFIIARSATPEQTAQLITKKTGLKALTNIEFQKATKDYYMHNTGIPVNFGITIVLGFIIGAAIAGQTFFIFVLENLRHFGGLKAFGVTNRQILGMVLTQAAYVAFIGFSIGIGLCALFFELTSNILPLRGIFLTWPVVLGTAVSVVVIMFLSSVISIRKVLVLDPAIVFRG